MLVCFGLTAFKIGVMHQHVYDDNETFYDKGICGVYDNYGTGLIRWNGTRIYHHDGIVVI